MSHNSAARKHHADHPAAPADACSTPSKATPKKGKGKKAAEHVVEASPAKVAATPAKKNAVAKSSDEEGDWIDNIVSDATADWFNKYAPYPNFMTKSLKSLATFMFWHSLILTTITPLSRYLDGIWKEEVPPYWLFDVISKFFGGNGMKHNITYIGSDKPHVDQAFIMHATAGMIWLVMSYLQIAVIPKKYHKRFAWVALFSLVAHLGCALHLLITDQQEHMTLNKIVLASLGVMAAVYFAVGTAAAIIGSLVKDSHWPGANWGATHKDMMMRGWIWSISGAGPIRQVVSVMHPLGFGPIRCQEAHGSLASECLWPYFGRLTMIASWNLLMTGAYAKLRGDRLLTKQFLVNVVTHVFTCTIFGILSLYPDSPAFISKISGSPTSDMSWVMTYVGIVAEMMQLAVFFPKLFIMWAVAAPLALGAFLLQHYF